MFTLFLSLYSTISSASPEVKTNAQKRSTFHLIAQGFGQPMKKKIFLDGPRAPRSTILKKRWGSGDENRPTVDRFLIFITFKI